jgi:hypothetical protein
MAAEQEAVGQMPEPVDLHAFDAHQWPRGLALARDREDHAREPPGHVFLAQAALHADDVPQVLLGCGRQALLPRLGCGGGHARRGRRAKQAHAEPERGEEGIAPREQVRLVPRFGTARLAPGGVAADFVSHGSCAVRYVALPAEDFRPRRGRRGRAAANLKTTAPCRRPRPYQNR